MGRVSAREPPPVPARACWGLPRRCGRAEGERGRCPGARPPAPRHPELHLPARAHAGRPQVTAQAFGCHRCGIDFTRGSWLQPHPAVAVGREPAGESSLVSRRPPRPPAEPQLFRAWRCLSLDQARAGPGIVGLQGPWRVPGARWRSKPGMRVWRTPGGSSAAWADAGVGPHRLGWVPLFNPETLLGQAPLSPGARGVAAVRCAPCSPPLYCRHLCLLLPFLLPEETSYGSCHFYRQTEGVTDSRPCH